MSLVRQLCRRLNARALATASEYPTGIDVDQRACFTDEDQCPRGPLAQSAPALVQMEVPGNKPYSAAALQIGMLGRSGYR
jgi:hypothetical protein